MSKKLAVFFPGIGYTVDKPLMYYSRKIAASSGYEIKLLPYTGFPGKILGDRDRMRESYEIARMQSEEMLADIDLAACNEVMFIGKSIGTIVAAELAARCHRRIHLVLYTPLEETFRFPLEDAIVFTGSNDPWVGKNESRIAALCVEAEIPYMLVEGGNHSLETGDALTDIRNLQMIMKRTEEFVMKT